MHNFLKTTLLLMIALILTTGISYSQNDEAHPHDQESYHSKTGLPEGLQLTDGTLFGKDYDPTMKVLDFSEVISNADANNEQVILVSGDVTEVCQKAGCWMMLSDGTNTARVKTMHEFFVPKDLKPGTRAIVMGTFKVTEISEKTARHYNDEAKDPKVKSEDIVGPQKVYEIEATGVKIMN